MNKHIIVYIIVGVIVLGVAGFFSLHVILSHPQNTPSATSSQPTSESTPGPSGQSSEQPTSKTYPVNVYFSKKPDSDNDPSKVFPVIRTSPDSSVSTFAITELLKGPTAAETALGYFTTARMRSGESSCNGNDFTLTIKDKVATLRFCRLFDHLGVVADGQADSELKATLEQFGSIKKVVILNRDGNCEFDLSGMNLCKQ